MFLHSARFPNNFSSFIIYRILNVCRVIAPPVVAVLVAKLQGGPSVGATSMLATLVVKFGNGMAGVQMLIISLHAHMGHAYYLDRYMCASLAGEKMTTPPPCAGC